MEIAELLPTLTLVSVVITALMAAIMIGLSRRKKQQ